MNISQPWVFRLDPVQSGALHLLQSEHHAIASVESLENNAKTIWAWAMTQILKGQKVIIASRDARFQHAFFQICQQHDMAGLCYLKNDQSYFSSFQLARKKSADPLALKHLKYALISGKQEFQSFSEKFETLRKPVFDAFTWTDLADRLAAHRMSGRPNVLHLKLSPADFKYNIEEYKELRHKVSNYLKLRKINHPYFDILSHLKIDDLAELSLQQIKERMLTALEHGVEEGESLIRQGEQHLLMFIKHTRRSLKALLLESFKSIQSLKNQIDNYSQLLGQEFAHESSLSNFSMRLKSNFDRGSKELIKSRRKVKSAYVELLESLTPLQPYLDGNALDMVDSLSIESIENHLGDLANDIRACESEMHRSVNEQIKRLNSKNISKDHPLCQALEQWEYAIDNWAEELRASKIFKSKIEINALSIVKKLALTADQVRLLREIERATEKIDDYIFWKSFKDNLSNQASKVIKGLEFEEPKAWLDMFDQWYFHSLLEQNALNEVADSQLPMEQMKQLSTQQINQMVGYLKATNLNDRNGAFKHPNGAIKNVVTAIRKKDTVGQQMHLEQMKIMDRSDLFPIQLVSTAQFSKENGTEVSDENINVLYVLADADSEMGNTLASTSRKRPCHVVATNTIAKQMFQTSNSVRKLSFKIKRLSHVELSENIPWQEVKNGHKLPYYSQVADLFSPYLGELQVYHTRDLQIFSFIGQKLNAWMLDELGSPYKIHQEGLSPTKDFIVECLLDTKKPIVILSRDGMLWNHDSTSILSQYEIIKTFESLGLATYNSWSANWIEGGRKEMKSMIDWMRNQFTSKDVNLSV